MVRSRSIARVLSLLGTAAFAAACSGSDAGGVSTPPAPPVEQLVVSITPKLDSLLLGSTRQYAATVATTSGATRNVPVEFSSLTPTVATVSAGAVTAIAVGTARIVARAGTSTDTATLVVTPPQIDLRIYPSAVAATLGDTINFQTTIVGPNGAATQVNGITWAVSDSGTAQLVGSGAVTTLAEGEVQVFAQVSGVTATASVNIASAPIASLSIVPSNLSLAAGSTAALTAEGRDSRGRLIKSLNVNWTSSKPSVATVNSAGLVTAVAQGGAIISAEGGGKTALAGVNVSSAAAASVLLVLPNDSLGTGRTFTASATPLDASGNPLLGRPLAWQSSNPSVATINSSGVISAIAAGQTTISVICDGKVSSQKLWTAVPAPSKVAVVPATAVIQAGASSKLVAEVRDQFDVVLSGYTPTWSSTAPAIASVSSTGQVTGVVSGNASIKATAGALSGTSQVTVQNVPVATVSISPPTPEVEVGSTLAMTATARDSAGNVLVNRPVSWTSSSTAVATVSASGVVTGVKLGTITLTATVEGKNAQTTVTVVTPAPTPVSLVTVTLNSSVLSVGQATNAKAHAYDADGVELLGRAVTFSSDDSTVANTSADGRVKGLNAGSTAIIATVDGESGFSILDVKPSLPLPVDSVQLSIGSSTLTVGDSTQLTAVLRDSTGLILTGRTIAYSSSSTGVAYVSASGKVRALAAGTSTITATSEGKSASVTVTVKSAPTTTLPVSTVSVTLNASSLYVGQGTQGFVTLRDSLNNILTGRTLAWSSSNTAVATVNQSGYVTAVGAGTVQVSVQSEGKTGSASLTVQVAPPSVVKSVVVAFGVSTITVGNKVGVSAVAKDSTGNVISGTTVAWTVTSGAGVISLSGSTSSTTTATALAVGTATVQATVDGVSASASVTVQVAPPPPTSVQLPALPTLLSFKYPTVTGKSWVVNAGDNLQTALNNAQRGDEVVIQAGASFSGTYTLPAKTGTSANGWILVRSSASAQLPAQGTRVTPAHAALMPKIVSKNAGAALQTAPSASGWWVSGVEVTLDPALTTNYGLLLLGDGSAKQNSLSLVPSDLVFDRVYVHASPTTPTSRCIGLNSARTQVSDSYIYDCHGKGFDAQAIAGWNGPGPFKIVNNTLAGSGENIMFGGADPAIANLIPSDIEIRRNYVVTPASWKTTWTKKNLFELKNAQRLLLEGNVFDGSWGDAQVGFAFVLKSSNQGGKCTWCASRDITIRYNILRNSGAGFNLSGREGSNIHPVGELLTRLLIEQNIVEDINVGVYTGEAKFIQVLQNLKELTVRANTMTTTGPLTQFFSIGSDPAATDVDFQNNIMTHGQYGLFASTTGTGEAALGNLGGLVVWKQYVMIGTPRKTYTIGQFVPDDATALATGLGANQAAVLSATAGVVIP